MTANVSVLVDRRADALQVPMAALRFRLPDEIGRRRGGGAAAGGARADARGTAGGGAAGASGAGG